MNKIEIYTIENGVVKHPLEGLELSPDKYTYTENEMGENSVTFSIMIPKQYVEDMGYENETAIPFNDRWFVDIQVNADEENPEFERYWLNRFLPSATKDTKSLQFKYDLEFEYIDRELRRFRMRDVLFGSDWVEEDGVLVQRGYHEIDYNTNFSFVGDIREFLLRYWANLFKRFGDEWQIEYHSNGDVFYGRPEGDNQFSLFDIRATTDTYSWENVTINDATLWEVLKQLFDLYDVRWRLTYNRETGVKSIVINEPPIEIDHVFQYGGGLERYKEGGVQKINRTNKENEIKTLLVGLGGDRNLPANYFRQVDLEWLHDGIYAVRPTFFENLMPKAFRMYMLGWLDQTQQNPLFPKSQSESTEPRTLGRNYPKGAQFFDINNITRSNFYVWRANYRGELTPEFNVDGGALKLLGFDFGVMLPQDNYPQDFWDDLSTPPFDFKAWVRGWKDSLKQEPNGFYSPIDYVESEMKKVYGIREGVLSPNDEIYPSITNRWLPIQGRVNATVDPNTGAVSGGSVRTVWTRIDEIVHADVHLEGDRKYSFLSYPVHIDSKGDSVPLYIPEVRQTSTAHATSARFHTNIFPPNRNYRDTDTPIPPIDKDIQELYFTLGGKPYGQGVIFAQVQKNIGTDGRPDWVRDNAHGGVSYMQDENGEWQRIADGAVCMAMVSSINTSANGVQTWDEVQFRHRFSENNRRYRIEVWATVDFGIGSTNNVAGGTSGAQGSFVSFGTDSPSLGNEGIDSPNPTLCQNEVQDTINGSGTNLTNGNGRLTARLFNASINGIPLNIDFNVWIKDIGFNLGNKAHWGTNDAALQFTTGSLAGDEYEFPILKRRNIPQVVGTSEGAQRWVICNCFEDEARTKPIPAAIPSRYRLSLGFSEADKGINIVRPNESFFPIPSRVKVNTGDWAVRGSRPINVNDLFILLNIELPFEYVYMAENELERINRIELSETDKDKPEFSIDFDDIFSEEVLKNTLDENGKPLYNSIRAGNVIKLYNETLTKHLIAHNQIEHIHRLHIKTLTKQYQGTSSAK